MEDSILFSHIRDGTWLDIKCCYCDTEQSIYLSYGRRHGKEKDYSPKSRLNFITNFVKNHYKDIQYKLDQEKKFEALYPSHTAKTPDCAKERENRLLFGPFQLIDEDDNTYTFHPDDIEYMYQRSRIIKWLKTHQ